MLSAASRTRILLDDAFRKRGISYDLGVETDSVEAIKQYVAGGAGISILPDIAISPVDAAELDILPLPNLLAEEVVGVVTLRGRPLSQAAQNFIPGLGSLAVREALVEEGPASSWNGWCGLRLRRLPSTT